MDYTKCVNLIRFIYLLEYKMTTLTKVTADNLYETINTYVESNKIIIEDYAGMVNTILRMVKDGNCFTMDRDILRDAMESLTYMYCPNDDMNKDRLMQQLLDDDSDEEEGCSSGDEGEGEGFGNMDMLKMMQMMSGIPPSSNDEEIVVKKEGSDSKECTDTSKCKEECKDEGDEGDEGEKEKEEELIPTETEKETESEKVD